MSHLSPSNRTFHETVSFQLWIENIPHIVNQFIRRFQILYTAVIKAGRNGLSILLIDEF